MVRVVIIGGGMSGLAAGWHLARSEHSVVVLERETSLGGLARSFEHEGRHYPLGYHHILRSDTALLRFLARVGLLPRVHWSRQRMAFALDGGLHSLSSPRSLLHLPFGNADKLRLLRVMARALLQRDAERPDPDAATWIRARGGEALLEHFFEPLAQLKFGVGCDELSTRWLLARIGAWEGIGPLGYIPGHNWVHELVGAMAAGIRRGGGELRTGSAVIGTRRGAGGRLSAVELASGERVEGDIFVSTVPPPLLAPLLERDSQDLGGIRYTRAVSCVLGCTTEPEPPCYWTNFLRPRRSFGGLFRLELLNPSLGPPGLHLVNFVTHLGASTGDALYRASDDAITERYLEDHRRCFGQRLEPLWARVSRIGHYSPVFHHGYRNPPAASPSTPNLFFAGNYRTFPRITSTGQALDSGEEVAGAVVRCARLAPPA
jgi:protoporphyrinogen oxidase